MENTNKPFGGPLTVGYIDETTGLWLPQQQLPHNLVLNGAADIMAQLAAGNPDYAIATMYFEFTNGSVPSVTPLVDEGQDYYNGLDGVNKDFLRVAISSTPTIESSGVDYAGDIARFFGLTSGAVGVKGLTFSQAAGSKVYGAALAASPTNAFSGDVVFSRFYFTSLSKLNGSQLGVQWPITFS